MKYFTLVLLLAVVVVASAFPYESFGKRRRGGGEGRGGDGSGGKGTGGKGSGGQGRGPESSGSEAEAGGQEQQQQQQQPERPEQGEGKEFGKFVTAECREFLVALYEQRHEEKQAQEAAGGEEETRALKLLRELEKELSVRQDEEEPPAELDESACRASFGTRLEAVETACETDSDAEGCKELGKLHEAYGAIIDLVDYLSLLPGVEADKPPPIEELCYAVVSHKYRKDESEIEEEELEEEPVKRRKRQDDEPVSAYGLMWGMSEDVRGIIQTCLEFYEGRRREGKGKDGGKDQEQRPEAEGQGQGQGQGQSQGQGPDQEPAGEGPARRELIDFLLRKINNKRRL